MSQVGYDLMSFYRRCHSVAECSTLSEMATASAREWGLRIQGSLLSLTKLEGPELFKRFNDKRKEKRFFCIFTLGR